MVKISPNFNLPVREIRRANFSVSTKPCVQCTPKDVFVSSCKPSFRGVSGLFKEAPNDVPKLEVLQNVSPDFVSRVTEQISKFPKDWLHKFKERGFKIILAPTFYDAYKSQGVYDSTVEAFEGQNPKGTLGVTYTEGKGGKNFFVFADKPPYSDRYMTGIVNHELSHGVVELLELDKNPYVLKSIQRDVNSIIENKKFDNMTPKERHLASHYFFGNGAYLPIDEIVADTYAWGKGGGCYGSGLVLGVNNRNFMKNLFPMLSELLEVI